MRWLSQNKSNRSCEWEHHASPLPIKQSNHVVAPVAGEVHCAAVVAVPVERRAVLHRLLRSQHVPLEGYRGQSLLHALPRHMQLATSATTVAAEFFDSTLVRQERAL